MQKIAAISTCLALMMTIHLACAEFGDINISPNETTQVATETLLTSAMRGISDVVSSRIGVLYAQHFSETQYTFESRYASSNFNFNNWYTNPLMDLEHLIQLNIHRETSDDAFASGSNASQIAVARILKAYFFHFMTDRWGMLPYSEALKGREDFLPKYDLQETIYDDLFTELKEAADQFDDGPQIKGDFLFGGDVAQWRQFANTIRLIMALRLSKADPERGKTEFNAALIDGPIDSDVSYPYLPETNNENPWYRSFQFVAFYAVSEILVDTLRAMNDPRLKAYADPAFNTGMYKGMPYGIKDAGNFLTGDVSLPHATKVRGRDTPLPIYTLAQVYFSRAEAARMGWTSEDAQEMYEQGIRASWEQWGVFEDSAFQQYLTNPMVAYQEANALALIGLQKWIALYLQGYEAWAEWRRTGFPDLKPAPDALNPSRQIPRRQAYPPSERDINSSNYDAALSIQGPDALSTRMWWDVP